MTGERQDRGPSSAALAPVLAVARRRARDRWRSHALLGALVAATVAVAVATLTGAQRSQSALDRLRETNHSSDLRFFVDEADLTRTVDDLARVDGVIETGVASELFVRPVGSELFPDYQLLAVASRSDLVESAVDVPKIVTGRAPSPEAVDEIVLSEDYAAELGVDVGDTIDLESMTEEWIDVAFNGGDPGPPDGPLVTVELVGLARTPADFGRFAGHIIHLTPAFAAHYEEQIRIYTWVSARVTDPSEAGLEALASGPLGRMDLGEVDRSFFADVDATQDGLGTIAASLRLVALAAILAGLTATGLALARLARETLAVRGSLSAIGWTRAQLVQLVVVLLGPWVVGGILLGAVVGALASPRAVVGLARSVDPELDSVLLYAGWVAIVVLAAALVLGGLLALSAVRAARLVHGGAAPTRARPRLTHPLVVPIAVRRALFGASDRGGRASRGAVVAIAASVTVAVAALTISASIQRLQDDPTLSGQGAVDQRAIDSGESTDVYDQAMDALEDDDRVSDLVGIHVGFGISAPGVREMTALVVDVRRGGVGAPVLDGRFAVQPDEVAVGPATLEELGLSVGDDVELSSERAAARFRIVGTTLFPEGDFEYDSGLAMTVDGADRVLGGVEATEIHQVAFSWADGVDAAAADRGLADQGLRIFTTGSGLAPAVVANLDEVRDLPLLLAGLVVTLGLVTLLHALMVTTRLREGEAGTLRALGITPRAIGALVETHAAVLALVAIAAGLPLGVALGRQVWSLIARQAHVVEVAVAPWDAVARVVLIVLVSAALLALPTAIGAARQRPAGTLRAE